MQGAGRAMKYEKIPCRHCGRDDVVTLYPFPRPLRCSKCGSEIKPGEVEYFRIGRHSGREDAVTLYPSETKPGEDGCFRIGKTERREDEYFRIGKNDRRDG